MKKEDLKEFSTKENIIKTSKLCKQGFIIVLPVFILMIASYYLIYGWYDWSVKPWTDYFIIVAICVVGMIIHEGIHLVFSLKNCNFKFNKILVAYDAECAKPCIKCKEAVLMSDYLIQKVLPVIVTAIIPYIIAIVTGNFHLVIASAVLFGMCGVDIKLFFIFRKEDKNSYILDDDEDRYGGKIFFNI
ncbi:DUF3267 domain-containing protein [Clostridium sp. MSJ-8]|uniref:metalloprotease family protein n=1 Tax=Clostridium sp. MSJ-8 TaxID=2841510 RepID=UPI001C0EA001|nr:metalloprotease family protein [Clostridium sp. MSJ-8]MBU5487903.1 DUF3267 domain-containing protein [Clostridium sp. MSJ-8]